MRMSVGTALTPIVMAEWTKGVQRSRVKVVKKFVIQSTMIAMDTSMSAFVVLAAAVQTVPLKSVAMDSMMTAMVGSKRSVAV